MLKPLTQFYCDTCGEIINSPEEGCVLTPQIAGQNLKNKLGLIKFGNYDKTKAKIYT